MDANEQVATGLVGQPGTVANPILYRRHIAWHHIRRPGINDTDARKGLLQCLSKLEGDGQGDIFFLCKEPAGTGIEAPVTRIDHNGTENGWLWW
jgi:hypothetical protein